MSEVNEIAAALAKAQSEMTNPAFDAQNPHFRSRFASLAAVRNAVVPVLAKHGICLTQDLKLVEGGVSCTTTLTHASGQQMIFGPLVMPLAQLNPQQVGSASTYAKRYAMQAVAAVVGDEDDDAEAAVGRQPDNKHDPRGDLGRDVPLKQAGLTADQMRAIVELDVDDDMKAMKAADLHDFLKTQHDLYVASSNLMTSKERAAWKALVKLASDREASEPRPNGR